MVHSFVYPDSIKAFTEAAAADPQCAIAYWGMAISHRPNPLILPLATAVLKNGWEAVENGNAIGAKTERERDWLAAIELYYKDYDKVDQTTRGLDYEKAMERLMQKYPDDAEAAVFYALALNETALPSDKTYANQLKAGAILERILAAQPNHPGALHYLIHSYDYTPLAPRALCNKALADVAIPFEAWPICSSMAPLDRDFAAGKQAMVAGDWNAAIKALVAAGLRDARNVDIQNYLGYVYRLSLLRSPTGPGIGLPTKHLVDAS